MYSSAVLSQQSFTETSVGNQVGVIALKRLSLLLVEISPQTDHKSVISFVSGGCATDPLVR